MLRLRVIVHVCRTLQPVCPWGPSQWGRPWPLIRLSPLKSARCAPLMPLMVRQVLCLQQAAACVRLLSVLATEYCSLCMYGRVGLGPDKVTKACRARQSDGKDSRSPDGNPPSSTGTFVGHTQAHCSAVCKLHSDSCAPHVRLRHLQRQI